MTPYKAWGDSIGSSRASRSSADSLDRVILLHSNAQLYGADRMAIQMARSLVRHDLRVTVVLPYEGPIRSRLEDSGVDVIIVPSPILRREHMSPRGLITYLVETLRSLPRMVRFIRQQDAAVVIVNTLSIPLWVAASRLGRMPTIGYVHEAEENAPLPFRIAVVSPMILARRIIAISEASRRSVIRPFPWLDRRLRVIYNGVVGPGRVEQPRPILQGPVRLLFIGRLSERKGPDIAIDAVADLRTRGVDAQLEIVGRAFPGREEIERSLEDRVRRLGLMGVVTFSGELPEPWSALERSDIAIVPSREEPFGNTAIEAMLACRPVVVADVQGLSEITAATNGPVLATSGDPHSFADRLESMIFNWPAAVARASQSRQAARDRFGLDRYAMEISAIVDSLRE